MEEIKKMKSIEDMGKYLKFINLKVSSKDVVELSHNEIIDLHQGNYTIHHHLLEDIKDFSYIFSSKIGEDKEAPKIIAEKIAVSLNLGDEESDKDFIESLEILFKEAKQLRTLGTESNGYKQLSREATSESVTRSILENINNHIYCVLSAWVYPLWNYCFINKEFREKIPQQGKESKNE